MSEDEQPMPGSYFPTNSNSDEYAKRLGGFDIYKSTKVWMAFVAVEDNNNRKSIKWYRWQKRGDNWKITLCNMKIDYLDFDSLKRKISILKTAYQIK